jgi:N-methylhydantoinase A
MLTRVRAEAEKFVATAGADAVSSEIRYSIEGRYPHQVWEVEVPLRNGSLSSPTAVDELRRAFHDTHHQLFAIRDDDAPVEVVSWRAHARCTLRTVNVEGARSVATAIPVSAQRPAYFPQTGRVDALVYRLESLRPGERIHGPALIESSTTTIVIDPDASCEAAASGSVVIHP